jgi:uncharacterized protein YgbK (DUF1537 family)
MIGQCTTAAVEFWLQQKTKTPEFLYCSFFQFNARGNIELSHMVNRESTKIIVTLISSGRGIGVEPYVCTVTLSNSSMSSV